MRRPILPESMNTRVSFNNTAKGASKPLFRNLLRRQPYMIIVTLALVVLLQAVFLPWFFFPQTKTTDDLVISPPGRATTKQHSTAAADGASFNNYPIYLQQDKPFHSTVHCVGETHHEDTAWMHRSCHFNYLCFDTSSKEFLVVESPYEQKFQQRRVPNVFVSTELSSRNPNSTSLALGGINPRWKGNDFNQGIEKVRWFPKRLKEPPKEYYLLDPSVVLVPFHSFAAHNVGHMLVCTSIVFFGILDGSRPNSPCFSFQLYCYRMM